MADVSDRVNAMLQERARQQHHLQWTEFVNQYAVNLLFPANVVSKDSKKKIKSNKDLINARLLENGILFEDLQNLPQLQSGVAKVVENLVRTGCFQSVQLEVDKAKEGTSEYPHQLNVILDEKNWYSLYVGGGFKHEGIGDESGMMNMNGAKFPKAQFETSATLLNLTGYLDQSILRYTVDQTSTSTLLLSHERPLYSWLGDETPLGAYLLALPEGSQYSLGIRANLDTLDYDWTRSYKEYQRCLTCRVDNTGRVQRTEMAPGYYWGLDWTLTQRDVVPRKHPTLPYAADASQEIVALSGTSLTHSLTWEVRTNGDYCDSRFQPSMGWDAYSKIQVAGPPGDVGFAKAQGGVAVHIPVFGKRLAVHGSCSGGVLQDLSYNGLCISPPTISDRFFVGGPMQLRGFLPAGIGPRSKSGGSTSPGGDALGGSLYYTATVAASVAPGGLLADYGVRLFSFANAGTLVGKHEGIPMKTILNSTRTAVGAGISAATPMGRLEATYAWPLRYGPRDVRRNLQFGFGFHFG